MPRSPVTLATVLAAGAALACAGGPDVTGDVVDPLRDGVPVAGAVVRLYALTPDARARIAAGCQRADSVDRALVARMGAAYPRAAAATSPVERGRWLGQWDGDKARREAGWRALESDVAARLGAPVATDTTDAGGRFEVRVPSAGEYVAAVTDSAGAMAFRTIVAAPGTAAHLAFIAGTAPATLAVRPDLCVFLAPEAAP